MKRILSLVLVLGMMLTLLGIIPAKAAGEPEYPYTNYTFDTADDVTGEDAPFSVWSSTYNITFAGNGTGVGGSNGAAYAKCVHDAFSRYYIAVDCPEILVGRKAKVSLWFKLDDSITLVSGKQQIQFIVYGKDVDGGSSEYYGLTSAQYNFNSHNWTYVEVIADNWDGKLYNGKQMDVTQPIKIEPRIGSGNPADVVVGGVSDTQNLAYYLDEFRVEPIPTPSGDSASVHYTFDEAEDINSFSSKMGYTITAANTGYNGSAGSAYMTHASGFGRYRLSANCAETLVGNKAKISFMLKLDTTKTKMQDAVTVQFVIFGTDANNASATVDHYNFTTGAYNFNSGNWVKVEYFVNNWNGITSNGNKVLDTTKPITIEPRLMNGQHDSVIAATGSPTTTIAYWFDDFKIEPCNNITFYKDASATTNIFTSGASRNTGAGCDGQAGYYAATADARIAEKINLKANTLYKISLYAKANGTTAVGKNLNAMIVHSGSRLDKTNDSINASVYPAPYWGGDVYQYVRFDKTLTADWQYMEIYVKRNVSTFVDQKMEIRFRSGNSSSGSEGAYDMDNIKVETVGEPITNGDFEDVKGAPGGIPQTIYPPNGSGQDYMGSNDDYLRYGNFYGWMENNVTVTSDASVRPGSTGSKSAKIVTTGADAEIKQGIFVQNETEKVFKFWAKGEGESIGKSIQVKLNRTVPSVDSEDIYTVPNVELLGENLTLTGDWQQYTIPYAPDFTYTGTLASNENNTVIPRLPFFSIVVDGGATGMTYYLDDVTFEDYSTELIPPTVTGLTYTGPQVKGKTLTQSFNFVSFNGGAPGTYFVRVCEIKANGQEATLAITPVLSQFTIPETAAGSTLRFDFLPAEYTASGDLYGDFVSYTTDVIRETSITITPSFGSWSEDSITGHIYAEEIDPEAEDLDLLFIVAIYDANDCLMKYEVLPIEVEAGEPAVDLPLSINAVGLSTYGFASAAKAKAFVWGGTGNADTDTFTTNMETYAEIVIANK